MNTAAQTATISMTSKGARIWIQALRAKGITGARYDVTITDSAIVLTFGDTGKRKVTESKGGIVDLVGKKYTLWAKGADTATVHVSADRTQLLITHA